MLIGTTICKNASFENSFRALNKLGIKYVQYQHKKLRTAAELSGIKYSNSSDFFRAVKQIADRFGIGVLVVHSWKQDENDKFETRIKRFLRCSKTFNSKFVVLHLRGKDSKKKFKIVNRYIPKFEKQNTKVCIENDYPPYYNASFTTVNEILKSIPKSYICFDTCHSLQAGLDTQKFFEKFKSRIALIHLSDYSGTVTHQVPFTGLLEKYKTMKMELRNFDGPIIFELKYNSLDDHSEKLKQALKNISE